PPGASFAQGTNEAHFWELAKAERSAALTRWQVFAAEYSPDGKCVALTAMDFSNGRKAILFADVAARKLREEKIPYAKELRFFTFSADGSLCAAGGDDHTIRIWDVATLKEVAVLSHGPDTLLSALAFAPDGKTLAAALNDKTIQLWAPKASSTGR